MGESRQATALLSSSVRGTEVPRSAARRVPSKFGAVARALWPVKPALNLSQRVGCTERHANLLIAGRRKPNARAMHALVGEILAD